MALWDNSIHSVLKHQVFHSSDKNNTPVILQSKKAYLILFANKNKNIDFFIEISPKIEVEFNKFVNATKGLYEKSKTTCFCVVSYR